MPFVTRYFEQDEPHSEVEHGVAFPLSDYFDRRAVVVLGGPGIGKTREFEEAASRDPDAVYCTVSQFLNDPIEAYQDKTVYLDALDEHRAEVAGQTVMDAIVGRLMKLDRPKVRLSCRNAEWHEGSDVRALSRVTDGEPVYILQMRSLSIDDIKAIAADQINDIDEFLDGAQQRDVMETISNPENLLLYLEVYKDSGGWPNTRAELMEKSVRLLLREENEQHDRVRGDGISNENLLHVAEDLSAVHVLSDIEGFALSNPARSDAFPAIKELSGMDQATADVAARRRLFSALGTERVAPQHKTTGDYLAARALVRRIQSGQLSLKRALSLVTGKDGGTLSHLRDVYAWMIALLPQHSRQLLRADPFGAMVYGDAAQWPTATKRAALDALREHARENDPWFRDGHWSMPLLGGMASKEMVDVFRHVLRTEMDAHVMSVVISILEYGSPLPELGDGLLAFVRDVSRPKMVWLKDDAISAFAKACPDRLGELQVILDEVHTGVISDNDLALRRELLRFLYPAILTPDQAVQYFVDSNQTDLLDFGYFVRHELVERTPDDLLLELADALIRRRDKYETLSDFDARRLAGALIARLLKVHGEHASVETIYAWLGLYLDKYGHHRLDAEHSKSIIAYVEGREGLYEGLFRHWLAHTKPTKEGFWSDYKFGYRVLHAKPPEDFCVKLLEMAEKEIDQSKADMLFRKAAIAVMHAEPESLPVTWEDLHEFVESHPRFVNQWGNSLYCDIEDWRYERKESEQNERQLRENVREANVKILSKRIKLLRSGHDIHYLNSGAQYWCGWILESDGEQTPFERVTDSANAEIAEAMIMGFEALLNSEVQYTPYEIAALSCKSQHYLVTYPILAGADIVAGRSQDEFLTLPDVSLKAALAYRTLHSVRNPEHDWDDWLFASRPDLAAEVLEDIWRVKLKGGKTRHLDRLYIEKKENPVTPVVLTVIYKLLTENPALPSQFLSEMLTVVLRHGDPEVLRETAFAALQNGRLRGERHTIWLAMACLFDPDNYADKLQSKVRKNVRNLWAAYNILLIGANRLVNGQHSAPQLAVAMSILGKLFRVTKRRRGNRVGVVDPNEDATQAIQHMINNLSGLPTENAATAFERLCADPALHEWRDHLRHAKAVQAKNIREKNFEPLSAERVCAVLAGGAPGNVRDLQAIVVDALDDLAPTLHGGNPNRWVFFWNTDQYGRPLNPKIENLCRDAVLEWLRPTLESRCITAEPEAYAAGEKRVDIRATICGIGTLPTEMKRDSNSEIWTGMKDQLVERYTNDPKTEGHGVFVVFWFGNANVASPPKALSITKPNTPQELLAALETIKPDPRIEVRVLDVSKPAPSTGLD